MLEIPQVFLDAGYFKGLDAYLWWIFTALCVVACVVFLIRMKRSETPSQKHLYLAYGLFSLGYGITRVLFNIGIYIPDQYEFYTTLGYFPSIAGGIALIFVAELHLVPKTKKLITIIMVGVLVIAILSFANVITLGENGVYNYYLIVGASLLAVLFISIIYIVLLKYSTGGLRRKTLGAFLGILLLSVAAVLDSQVGISLLAGNILIPPILIIVGIVLFVVFQRAT